MTKTIYKIALFSILGLAIAIAIGVGLFFYEESRRTRLLTSYRPPLEFTARLREEGARSASIFMQNNESKMCFLDGYGSSEDLSALNDQQRKSMPKDILPSEDLAWYLIFFADNQHTRIYLLDKFGEQGLDLGGYGCLGREQPLTVVSSKSSDQPSHFCEQPLWFKLIEIMGLALCKHMWSQLPALGCEKFVASFCEERHSRF